ncbi:hypothetical protein GCM10010307_01920 [Streptomyces vastus]|uniref:Uncharacterized protein n=1 Tax=Streptomyces vastus TaxID=285451 RepID=A0ABP6CJS9_9ACTN
MVPRFRPAMGDPFGGGDVHLRSRDRRAPVCADAPRAAGCTRSTAKERAGRTFALGSPAGRANVKTLRQNQRRTSVKTFPHRLREIAAKHLPPAPRYAKPQVRNVACTCSTLHAVNL